MYIILSNLIYFIYFLLSVDKINRRREDVKVRILHAKLSSRSKKNDLWKNIISIMIYLGYSYKINTLN